MNNHQEQQQDELLRELDFIRLSIMLKPIHAEYLHNIDPDNQSKAIRIIIDQHMRQGRIQKMQQHLLILMVFIILVLGVCQIILW